MPVQAATKLTMAQMEALATLANAKTGLTGKPYKFLPPYFVVDNEAAMLALHKADYGTLPGGLAIRRDNDYVYRLTGDYKVIEGWTPYNGISIYETDAAVTAVTGMSGAMAFAKDTKTLYRWSVENSRWETYGNWRLELKRLRAAMAAQLYYQGRFLLDAYNGAITVDVDGELYQMPVECLYDTFCSHRFSFPVSSPNWGVAPGFPVKNFGSLEYVYPGNGAVSIDIELPMYLQQSFFYETAGNWKELQIRMNLDSGMPCPKVQFVYSFTVDAVPALVTASDNLGLTTHTISRTISA